MALFSLGLIADAQYAGACSTEWRKRLRCSLPSGACQPALCCSGPPYDAPKWLSTRALRPPDLDIGDTEGRQQRFREVPAKLRAALAALRAADPPLAGVLTLGDIINGGVSDHETHAEFQLITGIMEAGLVRGVLDSRTQADCATGSTVFCLGAKSILRIVSSSGPGEWRACRAAPNLP